MSREHSYFVIVNNNNDQMFWNTRQGWVETEYETRFRQAPEEVDVPFGGRVITCAWDDTLDSLWKGYLI